MKLLELFAGSRSIGKAAERRGWRVCSVDIQPFKGIDVVADITRLRPSQVPFVPDAIWASPPCTTYSVLSLARHWTVDGIPKTDAADQAMTIVSHTIRVIQYFADRNPRLVFYIENPRGKLRSLPLFRDLARATVSYCKYGDKRMKPTDIWTNNLAERNGFGWRPRPMCFPGNPDCHHESCPRSRNDCGTIGLGNAYDRSKIPAALAREVIVAAERAK